MSERQAAHWRLARTIGVAAGAVGLLVCLIVGATAPDIALRALLPVQQFWLGASMGALALLMIHNLTGGRWGEAIQPMLRAAGGTLPLALLFLIPILIGVARLYVWVDPTGHPHEAIIRNKLAYLNVPFFLARAAGYAILWTAMAWLFAGWGSLANESSDSRKVRLRRTLAGPCFVLYALSITLAATDWIMSLMPEWYSSALPVVYGALQVVTGLAIAVGVYALLAGDASSDRPEDAKAVRDLGNMLLAGVMFWAYVSFCQFMLIWAANLPDEVVWYLPRMTGGWEYVGASLILFQFFAPFFLLLFHQVKGRARNVAGVACIVLAMVVLNWCWQVLPCFPPESIMGAWREWLTIVAAMLGVGGFWIAVYASLLKRQLAV